MVVCEQMEGLVASQTGPFFGQLAHGFACGAHIPVHVSRPWNALDDPARDYQDDRESIAERWDVTTAEDWHQQGYGGQFCDHRTAEAVVLRAGELCRRHYTSWADLSAGYALGRVIRFDNESYGHMYSSALGPHRVLLADRSSPWWHLPFA